MIKTLSKTFKEFPQRLSSKKVAIYAQQNYEWDFEISVNLLVNWLSSDLEILKLRVCVIDIRID